MKKQVRGCGKTCDCPRMKEDWSYLERCYNYINLVRDGMLTLDDLVDVDWNTANSILIEEAHQKQLLEEHAKKIKEILG